MLGFEVGTDRRLADWPQVVEAKQPDQDGHGDSGEADAAKIAVEGNIEAPGCAAHRADVSQPGDDLADEELPRVGEEAP